MFKTDVLGGDKCLVDLQREFSGLTLTFLIYTLLPRLVEFLFAKLSLSNP